MGGTKNLDISSPIIFKLLYTEKGDAIDFYWTYVIYWFLELMCDNYLISLYYLFVRIHS